MPFASVNRRPNSAPNVLDLRPPYVCWHRGGSQIWPEDTLEAFGLAALSGAQLIKVDAVALSDGNYGVMHDSTVDRTTTGTGASTTFTTAQWLALVLDCQTYTGGALWKNLTPPTLDQVLALISQSPACLVIERKSGGVESDIITRIQAAGMTHRVIVNSFQLSDCQAAVAAGMEAMLASNNGDVINWSTVKAAGVNWASCYYADATNIAAAAAAGLRVFAYPVNRHYYWASVQAAGAVGCFADAPLYVQGATAPTLYRRTTDPFALQTSYPGILAGDTLDAQPAASWVAPNKLQLSQAAGRLTVLQGWACPLANPTSYTIALSITYDALAADTTRWAGVAFSDLLDLPFTGSSVYTGVNGYHVILRENGTLELDRHLNDGATTAVRGTQATAAVSAGQTVTLQITVTPTTITVTRTDVSAPNSITVTDATYRGQYVHFRIAGTGITASYSNVSIT